MPAKAAVTAQEECKPGPLAPRLAAATSGQRIVCFLEAAPCVFAPFLGWVGCFERLCVKAPSGRQRCHVLAALPATTRAICTVTHLTSSTSETVCAFLQRLAGAHPGMPITMGLDYARSQRCALGQSLAPRLGMALLCLPASSPNLHRIERFWQFVNKPCLYSQDYADALSCQQASSAGMEQAPDKYREELASFLTLKFQSFKAVWVIGEESNGSLFPVARQRQRKVSSKAA